MYGCICFVLFMSGISAYSNEIILILDYSADIPVTTFALSSKIKGSNKLFALDTLNAYLGANAIKGSLQFDNTGLKPILKSNLSS